MGRRRKGDPPNPCKRCGGPKPFGAGRVYCKACEPYCPKCGVNLRQPGSRYCRPCWAILSKECRERQQQRGVTQRRVLRTRVIRQIQSGEIVRGPCEVCGAEEVWAYFPELTMSALKWLCRTHHFQMRRSVGATTKYQIPRPCTHKPNRGFKAT